MHEDTDGQTSSYHCAGDVAGQIHPGKISALPLKAKIQYEINPIKRESNETQLLSPNADASTERGNKRSVRRR
jgi:hypothetical protein